MSAAARRSPAKGSKLGFQISQIADVLYPGVGLDLIMIHNDSERFEAVVGSADEGFPNLSFLQLPVAHENENAATLSQQVAGLEHAFCLGDTHAERSRVRVAVRGVDIRMTRQPAEAAKSMKQGKFQ